MEEEKRKDLAYVGVNVAVEKSLRSRLAIIFAVKTVKVIFINIYNKKSIMILKLSNETSFKTSFRRRSPRTRRVGQLVGMEFLL